MEQKDVKKAFEQAENELKEKRIDKVKEIVKKTLTKIEKLDDKIKDLQEERKLLRLDIDDLKAGRLDRIKERQEKDPKAKLVSVVILKEKPAVEYVNAYYQPYELTWNYTTGDSSYLGYAATSNGVYIDGSTAKLAAIGTYDINGHIIHLR
jgi:hypothetical protein